MANSDNVVTTTSEAPQKVSAFKKWTQQHEQLWQMAKFFVFSMCSGATEGVTYIVFGSLLLIPLQSLAIGKVDFLFFHYDNGMFYDMIAYLVSTTVGNMVSFVLNRKKTFKSASNVTYSITATLIMIAFIIFYSTYFGPKLNVAIGELLPFFNESASMIAVRNFVGKTLMSFVTFVFVFLMDKFVILPESKEQKLANKARKEAIENGTLVVETKVVVNKPLAKKFLVAALVAMAVGAVGFVLGNLGFDKGTLNTVAPTLAVKLELIIGALIFGIGEILLFAFVAEKLGDEVIVKETEIK